MSDPQLTEQAALADYLGKQMSAFHDINLRTDEADDIAYDVLHFIKQRGWRPPARVIETLAELDACEKGTIVRTVDGSAWNLPTGSAVLIGGKSLPATVLWESGDPR